MHLSIHDITYLHIHNKCLCLTNVWINKNKVAAMALTELQKIRLQKNTWYSGEVSRSHTATGAVDAEIKLRTRTLDREEESVRKIGLVL